MVGHEAELDALKHPQALKQQPRPHEQDDGECQLRDHEHAAQAAAAPARCGAASPVPEGVRGMDAQEEARRG